MKKIISFIYKCLLSIKTIDTFIEFLDDIKVTIEDKQIQKAFSLYLKEKINYKFLFNFSKRDITYFGHDFIIKTPSLNIC